MEMSTIAQVLLAHLGDLSQLDAVDLLNWAKEEGIQLDTELTKKKKSEVNILVEGAGNQGIPLTQEALSDLMRIVYPISGSEKK